MTSLYIPVRERWERTPERERERERAQRGEESESLSGIERKGGMVGGKQSLLFCRFHIEQQKVSTKNHKIKSIQKEEKKIFARFFSSKYPNLPLLSFYRWLKAVLVRLSVRNLRWCIMAFRVFFFSSTIFVQFMFNVHVWVFVLNVRPSVRQKKSISFILIQKHKCVFVIKRQRLCIYIYMFLPTKW